MPCRHPPPIISNQVDSGRYFFGDLGIPEETPVAVVCAGLEDCAVDYRISRDTFPYHALEFVQSGHWKLKIGKKETTIGPGTVFLYGPSVGYRLEATGGNPRRKYFLNLVGPKVEALLQQYHTPSGVFFNTIARPERMTHIFDQLVDCSELPLETARPLALQLVELLLMRVNVDSQIEIKNRGQGYQSYLRARQIISERHASLTSIEEVATSCGLSGAYLSRLFKRFASEGALQYLTRLRMQHAAGLLLRHSTNVQETSAMLGYDDPFHFSRVFKRVYGLSPRAYLKSQQDAAGTNPR